MPLGARILRITVSVVSELQSIARTSCFINGRARPVTRGSPSSSASGAAPATTFSTASTRASIAALRTSWR